MEQNCMKIKINENRHIKIPIVKKNPLKTLTKTSNLQECLAYIDKIYKRKLYQSQKLIENNYIRENTDDFNDNEYVAIDEVTALTTILNTLYDFNIDNNNKLNIHLLQFNNYTFNNETKEYFIEFNNKNNNGFYNLRNLMLTNNGLLNTEKILFIFYQLLHIIKEIHELNLNVANLKLNNLYIDENYFLKIRLNFDDLLNLYDDNAQESIVRLNLKNELTLSLEHIYDSYRHLNLKDLSKLTTDWCLNKLSNFNYLLMLNCISGRQLNQPNNHPIFPWIIDFKASLRDLNMTKYRLNKGDQHLDYIYQASCQTYGSHNGYHITEYQSEITYYVYKARLYDRSLLCKYVRNKWVPNEYPSSLERLYEWTPEECIPEFYCDSNIFKSIHDDMCDLELPYWCDNSVEEFLHIHRNLLESSLISQNLSNWIDLIFGYKLSGEAAFESKNICAQMIQQTDLSVQFKFNGIVQLFKQPHPKKIDYFLSFPIINLTKNQKKIQQIEIKLDSHKNPLKNLELIENMLQFTHLNYHNIPKLNEITQKSHFNFEYYQQIDIKYAVLILGELFLFDKIKYLPENSDFNERLAVILLKLNNLPRLFQNFIKSSLQNEVLLSIDIIINQHLTQLFNFTYFNDLYKLFQYFYKINFIIENFNNLKVINLNDLNLSNDTQYNSHRFIMINGDYNFEYLNLVDLLNEQKFHLTKQLLPGLLLKMSHYKNTFLKHCNLFDLVMPLINKNLFENISICLNSFLYFFEILAKFLSTDELNKTILNILLYLLSCIDLLMVNNINKKLCIKLFDFKFMRNLKIFFGLNIFLTYIAPYLVEAISGNKDFDNDKCFSNNDVKDSDDCQDGVKGKTTGFDIFQMESNQFGGGGGDEQKNIEFDLHISEDDEIEGDDDGDDDDDDMFFMKSKFKKTVFNDYIEYYSFNNDCLSINTNLSNNTETEDNYETLVNISNTAKNTFEKLIAQLGPVLTCKYFCNDLLKMLTICYMNKKSLNINETKNCLNSLKSIDGDKYAFNLLECLKYVVYLYGEQIILLQYFTYVTNTIHVTFNFTNEQRLTTRLEASIISACVLVYYCCSYLDLKLLYDNLKLIINQILMPIIKFVANFKIKFPNTHKSRSVICFKLLDIILLLALRLGRDYTKIEMEDVLISFFNLFSEPKQQKDQEIDEKKNQDNPKLTKPVKIVKNLKPNEKFLNSNNTANKKRSLMTSQTATSSFKQRSYNESIIELDERRFKDSILNITDPIESSTSLKSFEHQKNTPSKYRSQSILLLNDDRNMVDDDEEDDEGNEISEENINNNTNNNKTSINDNDEFKNTFTAELAYQAYFNISRHTSGIYIDSILKNSDVIMKLCDEYESFLNSNKQKLFSNSVVNKKKTIKIDSNTPIIRTPIQTPKKSINSSSFGSSFNENISIIGSQIQIQQFQQQIQMQQSQQFDLTTKFNEEELQRFKATKVDTSRHLTDNWLAYWEHAVRQNNDEKFDFKHINLTSLNGHTNSIKCLTYMYDNELLLMSASKDKTVKLWSLKNFKTLNAQWTYTQHKKSVFNVLFLNNLRQCVSCDGQIHTWDPFYGRKLGQYDWQSQIQCQTSIDNQICFGTQDNLIKFIDLRTKNFTYEFRTCTGTSSSIKFLTTNNENNLLVGFTNGIMCLLDIRSGILQESFKIHESEILQLKFFNKDRFVCTFFDGSMALCSSNTKLKLLNLMKVYSDPVTCISVNDNQMISGTQSNKIGIHSNIDKLNQITYSSSRLLPDNFKGSLSAFKYLPMNRLLALGSENGEIKIFC